MNGVVNFSVLDGCGRRLREDAGWALKEESTYKESPFQDELECRNDLFNVGREIIRSFMMLILKSARTLVPSLKIISEMHLIYHEKAIE